MMAINTYVIGLNKKRGLHDDDAFRSLGHKNAEALVG